jgi:type VI secretion system protein ImpC
MMRDKIGSYMTGRGPGLSQQVDQQLHHWRSQRRTGDESQVPASSEARVDVTEIPGKTGAYRAVAFLKPHYQLDELSVSLRLVANLPPPAGGD